MSNIQKGSAGGRTRALIQKQEAMSRIDEYNKHPNLCLYCNQPILAPYDKQLRETKRKKFCCKSCATKYNNELQLHNVNGKNNSQSIINQKTDEEIIDIFHNSDNLTDFCRKLGYKYKVGTNNLFFNKRLEQLSLNVDDLVTKTNAIDNVTKGELFNRRSNWQNARSTIQKNARKNYNESDKPKQCIICGYDKHYEVAHIKAVSEFGDNALISEINDIENLVALCPNHHWEYDNNELDISPYL